MLEQNFYSTIFISQSFHLHTTRIASYIPSKIIIFVSFSIFFQTKILQSSIQLPIWSVPLLRKDRKYTIKLINKQCEKKHFFWLISFELIFERQKIRSKNILNMFVKRFYLARFSTLLSSLSVRLLNDGSSNNVFFLK